MKLKNKKTGEVGYLIVGRGSDHYVVANDEWSSCGEYDSLAELNEEWEDVEEPKSGIEGIRLNDMIAGRHIVEIDFTKVEQAEKAVEKLKAWKRLEDSGISFEAKVIDRKWYLEPKTEPQQRTFDESHDLFRDIMFIFGGEE